MIPNIISTITKNNQLRIDISNLNLEHGDFKLCFSLVYSIISIDGAEILKQVGRYYELKTKNNSFLLTLQKPRIGTYNLSCGPEGIFMITKVISKFSGGMYTNDIQAVRMPQYETAKIEQVRKIVDGRIKGKTANVGEQIGVGTGTSADLPENVPATDNGGTD